LRIEVNKLKDIPNLQPVADRKSEIDEKIDALINLIDQNELDSEAVKKVQHRINSAIEIKKSYPNAIKAFEVIDDKTDASRNELLDEFSVLLMDNKFDSRTVKKFIIGELFIKIIVILVGIVMITLGFAMIIMPAPPYFEMFTIYYFNLDDGVTLMDLISLVVVLVGVYVLVRGILKNNVLTS
jgi:hypothetical protein